MKKIMLTVCYLLLSGIPVCAMEDIINGTDHPEAVKNGRVELIVPTLDDKNWEPILRKIMRYNDRIVLEIALLNEANEQVAKIEFKDCDIEGLQAFPTGLIVNLRFNEYTIETPHPGVLDKISHRMRARIESVINGREIHRLR